MMHAIDYFQSVRLDGKAAVPLLAQLPDVNVTNEHGENLLHVAITHHNRDAAVELIRRGINVNAQDGKGQTPLHYAAVYQGIDVAAAILENHGDISIVDEHGNTPLWNAVFHARGKYDFVELLVRFGATKLANHANKHGRSPIDFAVQIGDTTLAKLISK